MKTGHDEEDPDILQFKVAASGFFHVVIQPLNMVYQVQFQVNFVLAGLHKSEAAELLIRPAKFINPW